jgi:diguanylate cyclase (GGDEF)-like protein
MIRVVHTKALSVLLVNAEPDLSQAARVAGFEVVQALDLSIAYQFDAVLISGRTSAQLHGLLQGEGLRHAAATTPVVVVADVTLEDEADLLAAGADSVLPVDEMAGLARTARQAVLRRGLERAARMAYATDLATGLPHQAQLLEHLSQLLALREREPAPMMLLVLQLEGYALTASRLGTEAANVLRRKAAVRLRSALRASDVVASVGTEAFGVLLGRLESPEDGDRVAAKLVRSLQQPFIVAGQPCVVRAVVGLARYPEHGKDAGALLRRASAQAGSLVDMGREGMAGRAERTLGGAANDEEPLPP